LRPDGSTEYEGGWQGGIQHGTGKLFRKDGSIQYQAQWFSGKKRGKGIERHPNGYIKFEGEFEDDNYLKGLLRDEGGRLLFEGQWSEGKFSEGDSYSPSGTPRRFGVQNESRGNVVQLVQLIKKILGCTK
jgi:antitoxin component YwqK of YwqJK toxin-antitoxin module